MDSRQKIIDDLNAGRITHMQALARLSLLGPLADDPHDAWVGSAR